MQRIFVTILLAALACKAFAASSSAAEGFSLGVAGTTTATQPALINEAVGTMQNSNEESDASLQELVAQPPATDNGVQNPLVLVPKAAYTEEERQRQQQTMESWANGKDICAPELVQAMALVGSKLNCGPRGGGGDSGGVGNNGGAN